MKTITMSPSSACSYSWNTVRACGRTTSTTAPPGSCFAQADCTGINETCGSDGFCHTGDCSLWGCLAPQQCVVGADQKASCVDGPGHGGSGGAQMGGAGGATVAGGAGGVGGVGGVGGSTATNAGGTGGATMAGGAGGSTATNTGGAGGAPQTGGTGGM